MYTLFTYKYMFFAFFNNKKCMYYLLCLFIMRNNFNCEKNKSMYLFFSQLLLWVVATVNEKYVIKMYAYTFAYITIYIYYIYTQMHICRLHICSALLQFVLLKALYK